MKTSSRAIPVREIGTTLSELLKTQARLGAQLMEVVSQTQLPRSSSCCDIPEPCWMPVSLGDIDSVACPGATVVVRLLISNCDRIKHNYTVSVAGADAAMVSLSPTTLSIGPKERRQVLAKLKIPDDAKDCQDYEVILWVRGCKEHYARWSVTVGNNSGECCHEVEVEDCPDLIHHWYDHFYCVRPCYFDRRSKDNEG